MLNGAVSVPETITVPLISMLLLSDTESVPVS